MSTPALLKAPLAEKGGARRPSSGSGTQIGEEQHTSEENSDEKTLVWIDGLLDLFFVSLTLSSLLNIQCGRVLSAYLTMSCYPCQVSALAAYNGKHFVATLEDIGRKHISNPPPPPQVMLT